MSARPGSSRVVGPVKQCAIFERGGRLCVWCEDAIRSRRSKVQPDGAGSFCLALDMTAATLDHLDGNPANNGPENLIPSCPGCNAARAADWPPGEVWTREAALGFEWFGFGVYLQRKGAVLEHAIERVEIQRWQPLDRAAGAALAWEWHRDRMLWLQKKEQKRTAARREDRARERRYLADERAAIAAG